MINLIKKLSEQNKSFCVIIEGDFGTIEATENTSNIIISEQDDCYNIISETTATQIKFNKASRVIENLYSTIVEDNLSNCSFAFIF